MSTPAVAVSRVRKAFDARLVLEELSLEIPVGQTLALLGRNGAGKSTLLRLLLGLETPDEGTIRVAGRDPAVEPLEIRRRTGYLATDQVLYGWMTPRELCRFLQPFYPTWDMPLAEDFLERFELPPNVPIDRLTREQSMNLGLTAALSHRPAIVLLDDPACGFDPIARRELLRTLIELLQPAGTTVIYASHQLDESELVADAAAILHAGRILRHAPIESLRQEVRQIVLSRADAAELRPPAGLLDLRFFGDRVAATTEGAEAFVTQLKSRSIDHEDFTLSPDEIFEAYVTGDPSAWPRRRSQVAIR